MGPSRGGVVPLATYVPILAASFLLAFQLAAPPPVSAPEVPVPDLSQLHMPLSRRQVRAANAVSTRREACDGTSGAGARACMNLPLLDVFSNRPVVTEGSFLAHVLRGKET